LAVFLDRAALAATLALPIFVMHGRAIAEILVSIADACFLARCVLSREWSWMRIGWVRIAMLFWGWMVVCSIPGIGAGGWLSFGQALALVRFLLLPAALEIAILRHENARRWLGWMLTASALYIAAQTLLQLVTGRDIQGFRRNGDGELTGPFQHPRAAEPLSRLLFPVLLPPLAWLLARRRFLATAVAAALTIASVAVMVLIGQRMPLLLTVFGLAISGLMLRRLRAVVAGAIVAGAMLLAASAVVSPPAFYRLVTKFSAQMDHFPDSDYGLIAGRAVVMAMDHPWLGQGYDGFRDTCMDEKYFRAPPWPGAHSADGGGPRACNIHPHNHYLEAVTDAGLPGLALFCALVGAWWLALLRGIGRDPDPLRVGLFVSAFIHEWPIASTSNFLSVELSGFFFLLLGFGLAEARAVGPNKPQVPREIAGSQPENQAKSAP
jgi:O-antigen ligase